MTTSILRWSLKKAARKSMALGYSAARHASVVAAARARPEIRVLTYHRFGPSLRDPFCVSAPYFAKHIAWLAAKQLAVSLTDVEAYIRGQKVLKRGSVLVTIDDGFRSVAKLALPILKDHGVPAVAFVTSGNIGRRALEMNLQGETPEEDYLNWDELNLLLENGIAIGSHAHTHRSMGRISQSEAKVEALRSKEILEHHLKTQITSFAYPFGTRSDFNASIADTLRQCGYRSAFTSQHGIIRPGMDAWVLPRIKIEGGEGPWMFPLIAGGGLDGWSWIDRHFWHLQASGHGA